MAAIFIALLSRQARTKGTMRRRIKQDVHALLERAPGGFVCSVLRLALSCPFCHYLYEAISLNSPFSFCRPWYAVIGLSHFLYKRLSEKEGANKIRHNYFKLMASFSPPRGTANLCLLLWTSLCSAILSTEHNFSL